MSSIFVFKESPRLQAGEDVKTQQQIEKIAEKWATLRGNLPKICLHANLPAFDTKKEAMAFNESNAHMPILASWKCKACGCWHYWSTSPTDSNGAFSAGADKIPDRVQKFIDESKL